MIQITAKQQEHNMKYPSGISPTKGVLMSSLCTVNCSKMGLLEITWDILLSGQLFLSIVTSSSTTNRFMFLGQYKKDDSVEVRLKWLLFWCPIAQTLHSSIKNADNSFQFLFNILKSKLSCH